MKEYQSKDLFDLFDDNQVAPPDGPEDAPPILQEGLPPRTETTKSQDPTKKRKHKQRPPKKNGVFALPVYKAAYDSYKECRFRFRNVAGDGKAIAREVTGNLKRIMVNIELVHWQVKPTSILPDTFALVLETIIIIRAMKDFGDLSTKDYAIISKYTSELSKNMRVWSDFYNASAAGNGNTKNKVGDEF
jgi:hypothetical protein